MIEHKSWECNLLGPDPKFAGQTYRCDCGRVFISKRYRDTRQFKNLPVKKKKLADNRSILDNLWWYDVNEL